MQSRSPGFYATLLVAILVTWPAAKLARGQYHVATNGSDTNDGKSVKSPWRTLAHAAKAAPSGSTVHVAAGRYGPMKDGAVLLRGGKRLSFVGAGRARTVVRSLTSTPAMLPFKSTKRAVLACFAASDPGTYLRVAEMSIEMHVPLVAGWHSAVVFAHGASGVVEDCWILGASSTQAQARVGISADGHPSLRSVVHARNNLHWGWHKSAVLMGGGRLSGSITNCTIIGKSRQDHVAQNGIQLGAGGGPFLVRNNFIRDIWYVPNTWHSCGILLHGTTSGAGNVIEHNHFFECKTAYFHEKVDRGRTIFRNNEIGASHWGIYIRASHGQASGNAIDAARSVEAKPGHSFKLAKNSYGDGRANLAWPRAYQAYGNPQIRDDAPAPRDPGFEQPVEYPLTKGGSPADLTVADLNGDGHLDFATADSGRDQVSLRFGSGGSDFSRFPKLTVRVPGRPILIAAGEFSGTPGVDLAVATEVGRIHILGNDGAGRFRSLSTPASDAYGGMGRRHIAALARGDFDGRDQDDLAILVVGDNKPARLHVWNFRLGRFDGKDRGSVLTQDAVHLTVARDAESARDEIYLLAKQRTGSSVTQWRGRTWHYSRPFDPRALSVGDLDGKKPLDFVITGGGAPASVWTVFERRGGIRRCLTLGADAAAAQIGEFQKDPAFGWPSASHDVIAADSSKNRLRLVEGHQHRTSAINGGFSNARSLRVGARPVSLRLADLNGDGLDDVLVCNRLGDSVSVALSVPRALTTEYGFGCFGSNGNMPGLHAIGTPRRPSLGNASFGLELTRARSLAPTVLFLSGEAKPSEIKCTAQIGTPILGVPVRTNARGAARVALPIPVDRALSKTEVFAQWLVDDPGAKLLGRYAMSKGLRLRLGADR